MDAGSDSKAIQSWSKFGKYWFHWKWRQYFPVSKGFNLCFSPYVNCFKHSSLLPSDIYWYPRTVSTRNSHLKRQNSNFGEINTFINFLTLNSSCSAYSCLDACEVGKALETINVQYGANSYKDGLIEHACGVAKYYMDSVTCDLGNPSERMAIAVANSDIHDHTRKHNSKWTSNCKEDFRWVQCFKSSQAYFLSKLCISRTRMGIGTHAIDGDDIDDFQSSDPWYYLVRNVSYSVTILVMPLFCIKIWGWIFRSMIVNLTWRLYQLWDLA